MALNAGSVQGLYSALLHTVGSSDDRTMATAAAFRIDMSPVAYVLTCHSFVACMQKLSRHLQLQERERERDRDFH